MAPPLTSDAQKVAALRELLPATGAGIYLDTATAGPLPAETAAAMREAEDWELRVGRAAAGRAEDVAQREAEAVAVVAALIGGDPDDVLLTAGRRQALTAGLSQLDWRAGDWLVASALTDLHVIEAARAFCRPLGVEVELVEVLGGELPSRTRLVLLPHIAAATGELTDPAALRRSVGTDVWLALDASYSVAAVPLAVAETGTDIVVFSADRWALAPEGTAALWLGRRAGGSVPRSAVDRLPRTALLGMARSIGWLEMYVGLEWAFERGRRLAGWLADALAGIGGVQVITPTDRMATIVSFRLPAAWPAEQAADELGRRVFAILRPLSALSAVRASVAWFNTEEELARLVDTVAELARHTPDTLPQGPALTVL